MIMQIQRQISIQKPAAQVYQIISDLKNWNTWSPWYHCEPTALTKLEGQPRSPGQNQFWQGEVIGSGRMTTVSLEAPSLLKLDLQFYSPWKSQAEVEFSIKPISEQECELSWAMTSRLPWVMIFLKKMMMAYIGSDFQRGLLMLKELCETGEVLSRSIFQGVKEQSGFQVVGKKTECAISEISKYIHADFTTLDQKLKDSQLDQPQMIATISFQHDIPNGTCQWLAGFCYPLEAKIKVPAGFECLKYPKHKALTVDHYGPYRHLSNAWAMATCYQRGQKKKLSKRVPAYEIYKTMPGQTPEKEIHSQIFMPLK